MTELPPNVQIITLDLGPRVDKQYLADGVYADHDSTQIWLSTERFGKLHEIAIDDAVWQQLVMYRQKIVGGVRR